MKRFWADGSGRRLSREPVPTGAEVWDLYGTLRTRYVFLVEGGAPAAYETRSLPWQENPAAYHQILVTGDWRRVHDAYLRSTDAALRRDLEDLVDIGYYVWDAPTAAVAVGPRVRGRRDRSGRLRPPRRRLESHHRRALTCAARRGVGRGIPHSRSGLNP